MAGPRRRLIDGLAGVSNESFQSEALSKELRGCQRESSKLISATYLIISYEITIWSLVNHDLPLSANYSAIVVPVQVPVVAQYVVDPVVACQLTF